jgi:hypothetical protein
MVLDGEEVDEAYADVDAEGDESQGQGGHDPKGHGHRVS